MPAGAQAGAFWAQIGLFFVVICIFVALFWHLLLRPLAPKLRQPALDSLSLRQRGTLVLLLGSGSWAIVIGAFWDELWHRVYGIPFGEDFFWRPHLLMYFGFASAIGLGFWGLYYLNRHLRGNFQQRFRSNIIISLLILNAAFMLYVLPADPFWHWTFGEDLTAWSIPHLILLLSFLLTFVADSVHLHLGAPTGGMADSLAAAVPRWLAIVAVGCHAVDLAATDADRLGRDFDGHQAGMAGIVSPGMAVGSQFAGLRDFDGSAGDAALALCRGGYGGWFVGVGAALCHDPIL